MKNKFSVVWFDSGGWLVIDTLRIEQSNCWAALGGSSPDDVYDWRQAIARLAAIEQKSLGPASTNRNNIHIASFETDMSRSDIEYQMTHNTNEFINRITEVTT